MDLTTFLVGLMIALGLIGSDAYLNSNTLYLDANVSNNLVDQGYSQEVVIERVVSQIQRMSDNHSLVSSPTFRSSDSKSFAVALAEAIKVEKAMVALQDLIGYVPPRMFATVVGEGESVKVVVSGFSEDAGFLQAEADGTADDMESVFHLAAINIILKVDPYTGILHHVGRHTGDGDLDQAKKWIQDAIAASPGVPRHDKRAFLENLRGIVALLGNDPDAEDFFRRAIASKPDFAVAWLNLAFALVHQGRFQEAIIAARRVTDPWWWSMTGDRKILSAAQNLIGMARWRMNDDAGAVAAFRKALKHNPKAAATYEYWGQLLLAEGRPAEAAQKWRAGERNAAFLNNYPEVAMLYFWIPDRPGEELARRPDVIGRLGLRQRGLAGMHGPATGGGTMRNPPVVPNKPKAE